MTDECTHDFEKCHCASELNKEIKELTKERDICLDGWTKTRQEQGKRIAELEKKANFELEEHQCYSCGKPLKDIIQNPPEGILFTVCFDHGSPANRVEPEDPASEYYECYECIREREKKKSPNSSVSGHGVKK